MTAAKDLIARLADRRITRRELHRLLGGAGLGFAMLPVLARPARAADLIYYTWSGYDVPEFMPSFVATLPPAMCSRISLPARSWRT